jgi:hypothetical protein
VIHEAHPRSRDVLVRETLQNVARMGAGDRHADEPHVVPPDADRSVGRQLLFEPAHVIPLRLRGAPHHEAILGGPRDREVADEFAVVVQHRRQDEPILLRHLVGHEP